MKNLVPAAFVESEAKRIAQAPGESLLAPIARNRYTGRVASRAIRALERIGRRDETVARDAQDLAEQYMHVARRVVRPGSPAVACVISAAVADANVKESVLAELQIASIVVAVGRVNIINEYDLAPRDDDIVAAEDESGDPADRVKRIGRLSGRTSRELIEGVVEVDEPIVRKIRVYGDAKQPAFAVAQTRLLRSSAGAPSRFPFWYTRNCPPCVVINNLPSGVKAIAVGPPMFVTNAFRGAPARASASARLYSSRACHTSREKWSKRNNENQNSVLHSVSLLCVNYDGLITMGDYVFEGGIATCHCPDRQTTRRNIVSLLL